jgi:hypothetical protein
MAERIYTIKHRMQEILFVDFTGCSVDEVKDVAHAVRIFVTNQPKNSVRILADFGHVQLDRDAVQAIKEATAFDRPFIHRAAWINAEGFDATLKKSVQDFSKRQFPVFPSREAALDYLVTEENSAAGKG